MNKIKVAQIGTSQYSHGTSIWNSFKKQSDIFEIVGYAFPENEREKFPRETKAFEGYREMTVKEILNDPEIEAVAVETEEIYLTKYALMVVPSPSTESISRCPPHCWQTISIKGIPIPTLRVLRVVTKGSRTASTIALLIPQPSSAILKVKKPASSSLIVIFTL